MGSYGLVLQNYDHQSSQTWNSLSLSKVDYQGQPTLHLSNSESIIYPQRIKYLSNTPKNLNPKPQPIKTLAPTWVLSHTQSDFYANKSTVCQQYYWMWWEPQQIRTLLSTLTSSLASTLAWWFSRGWWENQTLVTNSVLYVSNIIDCRGWPQPIRTLMSTLVLPWCHDQSQVWEPQPIRHLCKLVYCMPAI